MQSTSDTLAGVNILLILGFLVVNTILLPCISWFCTFQWWVLH